MPMVPLLWPIIALHLYLQFAIQYAQAGWLDTLTAADIKDYQDPTGKVKAKEFSIKYNVSVAAAKYESSKK